MDRERLAKLMAMTTSDNDGEALNALRLANKMLVAEKLIWEQVLESQTRHVNVSIQSTPYRADNDWVPPHLKDKVVLDNIFRTIYAKLVGTEGGFKEFIDSVHGQYIKHGCVTQAQYGALRRAYGRG